MSLLLQRYPSQIRVGEIVTLDPYRGRGKTHPLYLAEGFIEEIVVDPTPLDQLRSYQKKTNPALRRHSGTYSIYGFEQNTVFGHKDWYIGDMKGLDFVTTGKMVTEFQLHELYEKVGEDDHMFQHDILTVIKNLGRTNGRNEL